MGRYEGLVCVSSCSAEQSQRVPCGCAHTYEHLCAYPSSSSWAGHRVLRQPGSCCVRQLPAIANGPVKFICFLTQ